MISTDSLARIALDLQLGISHQDRFHRLIQSVRSLLNSDASALLRYEGGQFIPLAIDGLMQDVLGRRFALKDHPRLEAIARAGDVVRFPADSALPDPYDGLLPDHDDFKVHACVGLPLFSEQALIGALTIDGMNPTQFDGISDEELRLVGALAAAAAQMETARIEANKQVRYLSLSVAPVAPDEATYPKAFQNTIVAFLIFSGIYLMLSLTASILREQVSS